MANIYALDVESTGISNHPTLGYPQVIEMAIIPLHQSLKPLLEVVDLFPLSKLIDMYTDQGTVTRYMPSMEIHKRATAVHGIQFKDLLGKPKSEDLKLPNDMEYMVGHSISYDYRCLGKPKGVKLLCTLSMARKYSGA